MPLSLRVARHLAGIEALLQSLAELEPEKAVEIEGLAAWRRVLGEGLGPFLAGPGR